MAQTIPEVPSEFITFLRECNSVISELNTVEEQLQATKDVLKTTKQEVDVLHGELTRTRKLHDREFTGMDREYEAAITQMSSLEAENNSLIARCGHLQRQVQAMSPVSGEAVCPDNISSTTETKADKESDQPPEQRHETESEPDKAIKLLNEVRNGLKFWSLRIKPASKDKKSVDVDIIYDFCRNLLDRYTTRIREHLIGSEKYLQEAKKLS